MKEKLKRIKIERGRAERAAQRGAGSEQGREGERRRERERGTTEWSRKRPKGVAASYGPYYEAK